METLKKKLTLTGNQGLIVRPLVFGIHITPIAATMMIKEESGRLPGFLQGCEGTGSCQSSAD